METGLSTRGAEKPAGLGISAVEMNPCIRASPRTPIVHAGPALGLQTAVKNIQLGTGNTVLNPNPLPAVNPQLDPMAVNQ